MDRCTPLDGHGPLGRSLYDGSMALPQITLDWSAVEWNAGVMSRVCRANGVELAPHSKETMCKQVLAEQARHGVWAISVADFAQLRILRGYGHRTFLLVNELAEPNVARALMQDAEIDVTYVVDSEAGVAILSEAWRDSGKVGPVDVLIEVGFRGGRAGCRTLEQVMDVAAAISDGRGLRLAGIEAYDGIVIDLEQFSGSTERDAGMFDTIADQVELISTCLSKLRSDSLLDGPATVSLGGSMFFDVVLDLCNEEWRAAHEAIVVLRCGSYIVHDRNGIYDSISPLGKRARSERLQPALKLWAVVLSRPEEDLAIIGFGKQHCPQDDGLPRLHSVMRNGNLEPLEGAEIFRLNEQHSYCRLLSREARELEVGDVVVSDPYHPSLIFQKWPRMVCVDPDYTIVDIAESKFS